eukprot:Nk52_evm41s223 gene=Nk52_evmTU41s223
MKSLLLVIGLWLMTAMFAEKTIALTYPEGRLNWDVNGIPHFLDLANGNAFPLLTEAAVVDQSKDAHGFIEVGDMLLYGALSDIPNEYVVRVYDKVDNTTETLHLATGEKVTSLDGFGFVGFDGMAYFLGTLAGQSETHIIRTNGRDSSTHIFNRGPYTPNLLKPAISVPSKRNYQVFTLWNNNLYYFVEGQIRKIRPGEDFDTFFAPHEVRYDTEFEGWKDCAFTPQNFACVVKSDDELGHKMVVLDVQGEVLGERTSFFAAKKIFRMSDDIYVVHNDTAVHIGGPLLNMEFQPAIEIPLFEEPVYKQMQVMVMDNKVAIKINNHLNEEYIALVQVDLGTGDVLRPAVNLTSPVLNLIRMESFTKDQSAKAIVVYSHESNFQLMRTMETTDVNTTEHLVSTYTHVLGKSADNLYFVNATGPGAPQYSIFQLPLGSATEAPVATAVDAFPSYTTNNQVKLRMIGTTPASLTETGHPALGVREFIVIPKEKLSHLLEDMVFMCDSGQCYFSADGGMKFSEMPRTSPFSTGISYIFGYSQLKQALIVKTEPASLMRTNQTEFGLLPIPDEFELVDWFPQVLPYHEPHHIFSKYDIMHPVRNPTGSPSQPRGDDTLRSGDIAFGGSATGIHRKLIAEDSGPWKTIAIWKSCGCSEGALVNPSDPPSFPPPPPEPSASGLTPSASGL